MENEEIIDEEMNDPLTEALTRAEKAEAAADKWRQRFKSEKSAKSATEQQAPQDVSDDLVNKKVAEAMFYQNNESARAAQKEIQELQKNSNLGVEDAYTLYMAKTNPSALNATKPSTGIDGYTKPVEGDISIDNVKGMSDEELEKAMKQVFK